MRRFVAGLAVLLSGCVTLSPEKLAGWQREQSALQLHCTWSDTKVSEAGTWEPWIASCEGRSYICRAVTVGLSTAYESTKVTCEETEASKAAVHRQVVTDRLALETSCPTSKIEITREADWSRGGEKAYRMTACGKPYVCTTAAGRTDCKAALAE